MSRWINFLLATDIYISELIWDDPCITISSKIAEARSDGKWWGRCGCKALNVLFNDDDHCGEALYGDYERARKAQQELERYKEDMLIERERERNA